MPFSCCHYYCFFLPIPRFHYHWKKTLAPLAKSENILHCKVAPSLIIFVDKFRFHSRELGKRVLLCSQTHKIFEKSIIVIVKERQKENKQFLKAIFNITDFLCKLFFFNPNQGITSFAHARTLFLCFYAMTLEKQSTSGITTRLSDYIS